MSLRRYRCDWRKSLFMIYLLNRDNKCLPLKFYLYWTLYHLEIHLRYLFNIHVFIFVKLYHNHRKSKRINLNYKGKQQNYCLIDNHLTLLHILIILNVYIDDMIHDKLVLYIQTFLKKKYLIISQYLFDTFVLLKYNTCKRRRKKNYKEAISKVQRENWKEK